MNRETQYKAESSHSHKGSSAALADAARLYIETHSTDKFSLQAVADALFVNGSYLLRAFKAYTGHTLLWYHNYIHCEKANLFEHWNKQSIFQSAARSWEKYLVSLSRSYFSHGRLRIAPRTSARRFLMSG